LWGSIFSFAGGKFFWKWPRQLRRPASVNFGRPLPPTTKADEVRNAVEKLLTADERG
jgi:acyl-[acyl-carrier-protein]-phospholipid O-acyltransferase/long-chain-fatty-acid--[acyl-carrier-protein] ligase